jgi:hypothetical protein
VWGNEIERTMFETCYMEGMSGRCSATKGAMHDDTAEPTVLV